MEKAAILMLPEEVQIHILEYCVGDIKAIRLTCTDWMKFVNMNSKLNKNLMLRVGRHFMSRRMVKNHIATAMKTPVNFAAWSLWFKSSSSVKLFLRLIANRGHQVRVIKLTGVASTVPFDVTRILNGLVNLEELNFENGMLTDAVVLPKLKKLKTTLPLMHNMLLIVAKNLQHLYIDGLTVLRQMPNNYIDEMANVVIRRNLVSVAFENVQATGLRLCRLMDASPQLRKFSFTNSAFFSAFFNYPHANMRELHLRYCNNFSLVEVWGLPNITTLSLLDNEGYNLDEPVPYNDRITHLNFSGELMALRKLLWRSGNLQHLGIGGSLYEGEDNRHMGLNLDFEPEYLEICELLSYRNVFISCWDMNELDTIQLVQLMNNFMIRNGSNIHDLFVGNQQQLEQGNEFPRLYMQYLRRYLRREANVQLYTNPFDFYRERD